MRKLHLSKLESVVFSKKSVSGAFSSSCSLDPSTPDRDRRHFVHVLLVACVFFFATLFAMST